MVRKKQNGTMTLEKLAHMIERGFEQMATKQELAGLRQEMSEFRKETNERFDKIELHLSASMIRLREDFEYLHDYVKSLERRLKRVEARK